MNRHLVFSLVAVAGLTIGLVAGVGFASRTLNISPVAGVTAAGGGTDAASGHSTPKAEPSESPEAAESPEPAETPEAADTPKPHTGAAGGTAAHPCNHGFYVSQAAHAHKGGPYVSSVARTDLGKNGDCSAPLPKP